jgi:hypothetical protein
MTEFSKVVRNFRESRWEATELNAGRLCEIVYTILKGYLDGGVYPPTASKPSRFDNACKELETRYPATWPDSARIAIPRVLVGIYTIRNKRGVGHVGGEVDANKMDAIFVTSASQWIVAELVRMFHATSVDEAATIIDSLVTRTVPVVWQHGDTMRVLRTDLSLDDKTLLLVYSSADGRAERHLAGDLEQADLSNYRRILKRLHGKRLVEWDRSVSTVYITPIGVSRVEDTLLPNL